LLPVLIETMGDAYPELISQQTLIEKVMKEEEESFLRTLENGIKLLDKTIHEAKSNNRTIIEGTDAFVLYDTYGFPLDLTELILRENQLELDKEGFEVEMQKQKERARHAAAVETGDWIIVRDNAETSQIDSVQFVGYDENSVYAKILRYRKVKQKNKEFFQIVFDRTPFYAEMGGQVGDSGTFTDSDGNKKEIFDTQKENNLIVHLINCIPTDPQDEFYLEVDIDKRRATECHHTATHLLHEALREVLGTHVEQKGSFVSPDILRFDFAHFQKLSDEEIREIEKLVTTKIREDIPLDETRHIPINKAKEMGAIALFGEKYGDDVRVVKFGSSVELCGGTHIESTGRIGTFRIVSESSIAAGVRRIEALSAEACENYFYAQQDLMRDVRILFSNMPDLRQAIRKFFEENQELKRQVEEFFKERVKQLKKLVIDEKRTINGIILLSIEGHYPPDIVRDIAFKLRNEFPEKMYFAAATEFNGKPSITLMIGDDLVKNGLDASLIVREAAKQIQGGGGGQAHFATAGGKDAAGLSNALDVMIKKITDN